MKRHLIRSFSVLAVLVPLWSRGASTDFLDILSEECDRYQAAAEAGHPKWQVKYANCFVLGTGRDNDYREAERLLAEALESGHTDAAMNWAAVILFKLKDESQYTEAVNILHTEACRGNPKAEFSLYLVYKHGLGEPTDSVSSLYHLERAAISLHLLARFAMYGRFVLDEPSDVQQVAAEYWRNKLTELIPISGGGSIEVFKAKAVEDELITGFMFSESELATILASL